MNSENKKLKDSGGSASQIPDSKQTRRSKIALKQLAQWWIKF